MQAVIATLGFLPAARSRAWKARISGLQRMALIVAVYNTARTDVASTPDVAGAAPHSRVAFQRRHPNQGGDLATIESAELGQAREQLD